MADQTLLPSSDIDVSGWTTGSGGTTNLYQKIDVYTGSSYVYANGSNGTYKFHLSNPSSTPASDTGHVLTIFARRYDSQAVNQLTVYLYQGASTLIASQTFTLQGSITEHTLNLTSGEAANISNYNDLRVWLDVEGSAQRKCGVFFVSMTVPDASVTISGQTATMTLSVVSGTTTIGHFVSGDTVTMTLSVVDGTVDIPTPLSTRRDIFTTYNASTDQFHVGQIDFTHNSEPGTGSASMVDFNHFVYSVEQRSLYRFKYEDTYPSAFINRESLTTTEVGGAYFDRPDSVILGFWSYGAWPDLDNPNTTMLYEASLPRDFTTTPVTNAYPYYGNGQPAEECFVLIPATEFEDPFSVKTFRRIWLWIIPPPSTSSSVSIDVTVYPHPVNAQGNAGTSVLRSTSVIGYDVTSVSTPQPVKLVYLDFDPISGSATGSVCGSAFEVKVKLSTGIGIWRIACEVESGGQIRMLDYQGV